MELDVGRTRLVALESYGLGLCSALDVDWDIDYDDEGNKKIDNII